jgi:nicotinamide-nucleotide amidase
VAYSNELKIAFGVEGELIAQHGAVSREVAEAMADAARRRLEADVGIGITGVAGPDELEGKPVGTVYTAVTDGLKKRSIQAIYPRSRPEIKHQAALGALFEMRRLLLEKD